MGVSTYRQRGQDGWAPGPFMMTIGQVCHACRAQIVPGAAGYRCPDGNVRCAICKDEHDLPPDELDEAAAAYWANRPRHDARPVITIETRLA